MRPPRIIPRRSFLARLSAWAGVSAILPSFRPGALAGDGKSAPHPASGHVNGFGPVAPAGALDRTSAALFEHHVGSSFRIVPDPRAGVARSVSLLNVARMEVKIVAGRWAPSSTPAFMLTFQDNLPLALPQDTYRVEHTQLGAFPLFIVPMVPHKAIVHYEAVFA